jgi:hypothetical protein
MISLIPSPLTEFNGFLFSLVLLYLFHYRGSIIYELAVLPIIVALPIAGNTITRTTFVSVCATAEPAKICRR